MHRTKPVTSFQVLRLRLLLLRGRTLDETTLEDLYMTLKSIEENKPMNEIVVQPEIIKYANMALERMLAIT